MDEGVCGVGATGTPIDGGQQCPRQDAAGA